MDAIQAEMLDAGISPPESPERWEMAWRALTSVWASKWNERAFVSLRNVGIEHADLRMSVLVQPVVDADYAFVIHTANPSTNDPTELYAEIVMGLGEVLVGNYPGRARVSVAKRKTVSSPASGVTGRGARASSPRARRVRKKVVAAATIRALPNEQRARPRAVRVLRPRVSRVVPYVRDARAR